MNFTILNHVYETSDYNIFSFKKENRVIISNINLEKEIKENGILVPIIVNEKLEVIDGQHRLEMAKKFKKRVPFIIFSGAGKKEIISINTTSKKWTTLDYIKSYASEGFEEYIKLEDLVNRYKISVLSLSSLAMDTTDSGTDRVVDGKFKFANYEYLVQFLNFYEDLLNNSNIHDTPNLPKCLYRLYRLKKFDVNRIIDNSGLIAEHLKGITKQTMILEILIDCYNKRLRNSPKAIKYALKSGREIELLDEQKEDVRIN